MKKTLLIPAVFCWVSFTANSQITVTSSNYNSISGAINQKVDTLPVIGIVPGNAGANQTYDFSALHSHLTSSSSLISAASGTLGSHFTSANVCLHQDTNYFYFDTSATKVESWGVAGNLLDNGVNNALVYSNPQTVITFPSTFNTAFTDVAAYDNKFAYNAYYQGYWVDSVREKESITVTSTMDGWGNVITPNGTFPCLRQNILKGSVDSTWAKVAVGNYHYWLNLSGQTSNTQSYSYISTYGGGPIVDIQFNPGSTTVINQVRWNTLIPNAVLSATVTTTTSVCGSSTGTATVTAAGGTGAYTYSWNTNPVQTTATATLLAAGTYTVTVNDGSNTVTAVATVTCVVGIAENNAENNLTVYPNPNSGEFDMTLNAAVNGDYTIELSNLLGQVIFNESLTNISGKYTKRFDVRSFENGFYLLKVTNKAGLVKSEKIAISH